MGSEMCIRDWQRDSIATNGKKCCLCRRNESKDGKELIVAVV